MVSPEARVYLPFALLAFAATLCVGTPVGIRALGAHYAGTAEVRLPWVALHGHVQVVSFLGTLIVGIAPLGVTATNDAEALLALQPDCVVYAADGTSPLDFLPYRDGKPLPGGFKLGINPGLVKHEGTQSVLWGEEVRDRFNAPELNLARYIKDGTVTDIDNGE